MPVQFKSGTFEGPYDLLLSLIEEEKLSLSDVSLSTITEQYLSYLDTLEEENPEELADFLSVAARLLLLKSRLLLPQFGFEEEEKGESLEDQLRLYKQFVAVSRALEKTWLSPLRSMFRFEPPRKSPDFVPPMNVSSESLYQHMLTLIRRLTPPKPLPKTHMDRSVNIKEKIDAIRQLLNSSQTLSFSDIVASGGNKTDMIVSFLALLELLKLKSIHLEQEESFGDIVITKNIEQGT